MPSFDIVSEITLHEVRNAVENANRDLTKIAGIFAMYKPRLN